MEKVRRGRYAPTPSGELHIGNARTALIAWLQIRHAGGEFILRMEDVDRTRAREHYARQIIEDLQWLGLDWDEGPDSGGAYGPYVQSEREPLYEEALQRLIAMGRVYPCFCSRADLRAAARAPHGLESEGPAYPGFCRNLTERERALKAATKTPSLRFGVPEDKGIAFSDGFFGPQSFPAGFGGDFILKRADRMYSYQLAVTVDDALMKMTDVLRGADLLDSTPRQLWLYAALGLDAPRFTHIPLVLGPDGKRLSKSHGDLSLRALREAGMPAETLVGWLAYLSGQLDKPEPVRPAELAAHFRLERIPADPVRLPAELLQGLNI